MRTVDLHITLANGRTLARRTEHPSTQQVQTSFGDALAVARRRMTYDKVAGRTQIARVTATLVDDFVL